MEPQEFQPSNLQNPSPQNIPPVEYKEREHSNFSTKIIFIVSVVILILLIGGGVYYAYLMKLGPFAISQYSEENLMSGIMSAASRINSSSYSVSASLAMVERDVDAQPFTINLSNADEINKQYANDSKRAQSISSLISKLIYNNKGVYPTSLQALLNNKKIYSYRNISINDPATNNPYKYQPTENGKNFALTVTFETSNAISQIKKSYKFSPTVTIINGKTVTFTKDSYSYFHLPSTPPKPLLATLGDYMAFFPPEGTASLFASAQSDFVSTGSANWKFNVDATGDFGDLTYKFDADALKAGDIYYFRINNIPTFLFGSIGIEKGQWISVAPSKQTSGSNPYSYYGNFGDAEKTYKEHRKEITEMLHKMVEIADEEKLIKFKNPVHSETVDGRNLYRYDLVIKKDAIVPFYKRVLDEFNKSNLISYYPMLNDSGYIEYLQSPEFSELFDYYQKNTTLTLWADTQGFPAIVSYGMRIVPQDSYTQLKDKQANLVFKLKLSDINKPVKIEAPAGAKDFEEAMQSSPYFQKSVDAAIKQ